jgi:predicted membrane protein
MLAQIVKLILAILLLLCLLRMPYGYYQFVRFTAMMGFIFLAYHSSQKQNKSEMIVYVGLAILFQPLIKIALGRLIWNIVDVIVAAGLLYSLISGRIKK